MNFEIATEIKHALEEKKGPTLSMIEIQSMTRILSDHYEIYAVQKGDVTFLAWITGDKRVIVKIQCW